MPQRPPLRASARTHGFTRFSLIATAALFAGCASAPPRSPDATEVASMEARLSSRPDDVRTLVRLGSAYRDAGRAADAARLLERAVQLEPRNSVAVLVLGLAYEDMGDPARAREHYRTSLQLTRSAMLRSQLEGRLELLRGQELKAAARAALARESELSTQRPAPRTLAVMPFHFEGGDESLRPLSRVLADMMSTDLGQVERVSLIERAQVQALTDELALGLSGAVDPATAARSGLLLSAGTVIQGRLSGNGQTIRMDAAIVDASSRSIQPATAQSDVQRLLDAEKELVFSVFRSMNIVLTPAEQDRISCRPSSNLQALLSYGLGLEAMDRGDMATAAQHFNRAAQLDPGFAMARTRGAAAQRADAASRVTTTELAQMGAVESTAAQPLDEVLAIVVPPMGTTTRDPAAEAFKEEGLGQSRSALLRIILRRPL